MNELENYANARKFYQKNNDLSVNFKFQTATMIDLNYMILHLSKKNNNQLLKKFYSDENWLAYFKNADKSSDKIASVNSFILIQIANLISAISYTIHGSKRKQFDLNVSNEELREQIINKTIANLAKFSQKGYSIQRLFSKKKIDVKLALADSHMLFDWGELLVPIDVLNYVSGSINKNYYLDADNYQDIMKTLALSINKNHYFTNVKLTQWEYINQKLSEIAHDNKLPSGEKYDYDNIVYNLLSEMPFDALNVEYHTSVNVNQMLFQNLFKHNTIVSKNRKAYQQKVKNIDMKMMQTNYNDEKWTTEELQERDRILMRRLGAKVVPAMTDKTKHANYHMIAGIFLDKGGDGSQERTIYNPDLQSCQWMLDELPYNPTTIPAAIFPGPKVVCIDVDTKLVPRFTGQFSISNEPLYAFDMNDEEKFTPSRLRQKHRKFKKRSLSHEEQIKIIQYFSDKNALYQTSPSGGLHIFVSLDKFTIGSIKELSGTTYYNKHNQYVTIEEFDPLAVDYKDISFPFDFRTTNDNVIMQWEQNGKSYTELKLVHLDHKTKEYVSHSTSILLKNYADKAKDVIKFDECGNPLAFEELLMRQTKTQHLDKDPDYHTIDFVSYYKYRDALKSARYGGHGFKTDLELQWRDVLIRRFKRDAKEIDKNEKNKDKISLNKSLVKNTYPNDIHIADFFVKFHADDRNELKLQELSNPAYYFETIFRFVYNTYKYKALMSTNEINDYLKKISEKLANFCIFALNRDQDANKLSAMLQVVHGLPNKIMKGKSLPTKRENLEIALDLFDKEIADFHNDAFTSRKRKDRVRTHMSESLSDLVTVIKDNMNNAYKENDRSVDMLNNIQSDGLVISTNNQLANINAIRSSYGNKDLTAERTLTRLRYQLTKLSNVNDALILFGNLLSYVARLPKKVDDGNVYYSRKIDKNYQLDMRELMSGKSDDYPFNYNRMVSLRIIKSIFKKYQISMPFKVLVKSNVVHNENGTISFNRQYRQATKDEEILQLIDQFSLIWLSDYLNPREQWKLGHGDEDKIRDWNPQAKKCYQKMWKLLTPYLKQMGYQNFAFDYFMKRNFNLIDNMRSFDRNVWTFITNFNAQTLTGRRTLMLIKVRQNEKLLSLSLKESKNLIKSQLAEPIKKLFKDNLCKIYVDLDSQFYRKFFWKLNKKTQTNPAKEWIDEYFAEFFNKHDINGMIFNRELEFSYNNDLYNLVTKELINEITDEMNIFWFFKNISHEMYQFRANRSTTKFQRFIHDKYNLWSCELEKCEDSHLLSFKIA